MVVAFGDDLVPLSVPGRNEKSGDQLFWRKEHAKSQRFEWIVRESRCPLEEDSKYTRYWQGW